MIHHGRLEGDLVSAERIERCLDRLSVAMVKAGQDGRKFLPLYQRLEYELAAALERDSILSSALARAGRLLSR